MKSYNNIIGSGRDTHIICVVSVKQVRKIPNCAISKTRVASLVKKLE